MGVAVWNIVIGLLSIAAGASGRFNLIGTNSPALLIAFGAVLVVWGAVQFARSRRA
jgi:hypothetical protein